MARGGADLLPAASEKLSDLTREQECPGSQSHPAMMAGSLGGAGGEDENESEDEKGCEVEAVAAAGAAEDPAVIGEWSGHVSEKNAVQEAVQDYYYYAPHLSDLNQFLSGYGFPVAQEIALS